MQEWTDAMIAKMPRWLRWILFLPTAFIADLASQTIYQVVLVAIPFSHTLRPYTDELIWRFFASIVFVVAGVKMAPSAWFRVACLLTGIKGIVAVVNINRLVSYLPEGGSLLAPSSVTNAPV